MWDISALQVLQLLCVALLCKFSSIRVYTLFRNSTLMLSLVLSLPLSLEARAGIAYFLLCAGFLEMLKVRFSSSKKGSLHTDWMAPLKMRTSFIHMQQNGDVETSIIMYCQTSLKQ